MNLNREASNSRHQLASEAAIHVHLLTRSVGFGHGRVAVVRLAMAVDAGADVSPDLWAFCEAAALASHDVALQRLVESAHERAQLSGAARKRSISSTEMH